MLDVHHRELLHGARVILQRHEVRRLLGHVDQNGERGGVTQVLHRALGRLHGRFLGSARHRIVMGFRRALVHQYEAHDGVVCRGRRHARIHPHVIVLGNIVVAHIAVGARRGLNHVLLA